MPKNTPLQAEMKIVFHFFLKIDRFSRKKQKKFDRSSRNIYILRRKQPPAGRIIKEFTMSENQKDPVVTPETEKQTKKARTRRILSAFLIAAAALIVLAVVIVGFFLNQTIKTAVTNVAPYFTGTPVALEKVDVSLLRGRVEIGGFTVGNPQGYSNPNAIELQKFVLDLDLGKLFSDPLVVEEVTIEGVTVDYEPNLKMGSNLQDIQANV